ncbi:hypothetical protein GUJ93_ZPchr0002g26195 [Zizania palustris]|uniref:Tripeptidyl peptidase II second Ig-like domain-containing protein n=1 Tax=Zizania palustris TaxID=103762 RepID=A0A8J5SNL2_ZIZPA|nr:hypothetical protein GUJ93_ZPchr0002g26195 [Zizania palustris]
MGWHDSTSVSGHRACLFSVGDTPNVYINSLGHHSTLNLSFVHWLGQLQTCNQLHAHENVQFLEKLKQLILFIERKLEKKDFIQLSFYSEPDGPVIGNGTFKSSVLVPGEPEAFYVGPPSREKLPKNVLPGSILFGSITYGAVSSFNKKGGQNQHAPSSYSISYLVPPSKVDNDKGNGVSAGRKSISEKLDEEVRDIKIKFLSGFNQDTEDDKSAWMELVASLKSEYPKYTPLLAKILERIVQKGCSDDKIGYQKEVQYSMRKDICWARGTPFWAQGLHKR